MLGLADAEVISGSWLQWVHLDGADEPSWETGCARWHWMVEPEVRRGILVFDLPASRQPSSWAMIRHKETYAQPAILLRGERGRARDLSGCHELSHILIALLGLKIEGNEEAWCNRFAVATLAPAHVVRRAWAREGANLGRIQRHMPRLFATAATLRLGELDLTPVAVFERGVIRYAAGGELPAKESRRLAKCALRAPDGRASGDGMRAYRLPDGLDRVGVLRSTETA